MPDTAILISISNQDFDGNFSHLFAFFYGNFKNLRNVQFIYFPFLSMLKE